MVGICFARMLTSTLAVMVFSVGIAQKSVSISVKRCPEKTINYEQGLMNNSIRGIITDALGFTWISTSTGLQRYNGYTLQTITPVADGDTIHIDYATYFLAGKSGSILIGYRKGILEYLPENNSFKKIISIFYPSSRYALMPIKETSEGIWCFEENKGIVMYNRKGVAFNQFPSTVAANVADLIHTEDYNITRKLVAVNDTYIFIRVESNKILKINTFTHHSDSLNFPTTQIIGLECNNDKVFVATVEGLGFIKISDGSIFQKLQYKDLPLGRGVNRSTIVLTKDQHLLVSVESQLFEFDTNCVCLKEIISLNREPLLRAGYIQIVYEDSFQRIWLLTHEDIKRIQNVETPFVHYIYPNQKDNFIRAIYYDKQKNEIFGGGYSGQIQLYDSSGNILWDKALRDEKMKNILAIEKLSADHYLLVTQGFGWLMLEFSKRKVSQVFPDQPAGFMEEEKNNSYANNIQRISDSVVLISGHSNIFRCLIKNGNITKVTKMFQDAQLGSNILSCCIYTSDKTLWASTLAGSILKLDREGGLKTIPIPQNYLVRCMAEDGNHHIWVGTERGLFIFDLAGNLISRVTFESGLLSDFIYALLPADSSNDFFASSNFGISLISSAGKVKNYTRELGLQENEFNTQSSAISPTGKLFFGGINGITAFYPRALTVERDSSKINITRLVVNDSLYNRFGGAWEGDSVRLDYNHNHLQFDIAATGLLNPNEYLYRYRLKGFEESWQSTSQPTNIRYTLEPGTYTLEVVCNPILFSNNIIQKKFVITIDPPWWKRWWAVSGFILLGALAVFLISYFIIWQRYQFRLEKLEVKQQLTGQRERISRELHDNIGSQLSYISSNIDWLVEAPESFSKAEEFKRLSIVNETAKNLVTDLRETIWAMKKESIMIDELADKMKSFLLAQCALQPQIEMVINEDIQERYSFSPTEALNVFRICQEAIVNCLRHAQAEKICFSIRSGTAEDYAFTIEDNGKGFVRQKQYDGHYGLENMVHRAAESGVRLIIFSESGKGTRITIKKLSARGVLDDDVK
jgi:ligand-binding sensor domain-containing protein/two-component sensor histidine kinase